MGNVVKLDNSEVYNDILTYLDDVSHGSNNTYIRYRSTIDTFFKWHSDTSVEFLNRHHINSIDYNRMKQFRSYLINDRKNANSTVNNTMSILYSLFRELQKVRYTNGERKYNISVDELQLRRLDQSDERSYGDVEWEEVDEMIELVKSMPPRKMPDVKAALIHIARVTGIRLSGLLNLRYKDLRREYGYWVLHHSMKGKKHEQAIKDSDAEMLLNLRKNKSNDRERIFKISKKTVERMMNEIIRELNIDENRNISFHSFRRLYGGEVYAATGNNITLTQHYLGHSNTETTRRYIQRKQNVQGSPALFIGENLDSDVVNNLDENDWQNIFNELSRSARYEIINKMNELELGHSK